MKKIGTTREKIFNYKQGRIAVPLEKLYEIAETLSVSIIDLLTESMENENGKVENELSDLVKEYKIIENQELHHTLIKS